jgi:hypothetical protein
VVQSEAALRKLAGMYPYDNIEDETARVTLVKALKRSMNELEREIKSGLKLQEFM